MRRLGGLVAALACLAMVAGACSKGGDKGAAGRATTTTEVPAAIAFTTTSFDVVATADPAEGAAAGAQAGIEATFRVWLDEDVLGPLRSAVPAGDLRHIFTAVTGERVATTPDRAAFVVRRTPPRHRAQGGDRHPRHRRPDRSRRPDPDRHRPPRPQAPRHRRGHAPHCRARRRPRPRPRGRRLEDRQLRRPRHPRRRRRRHHHHHGQVVTAPAAAAKVRHPRLVTLHDRGQPPRRPGRPPRHGRPPGRPSSRSTRSTRATSPPRPAARSSCSSWATTPARASPSAGPTPSTSSASTPAWDGRRSSTSPATPTPTSPATAPTRSTPPTPTAAPSSWRRRWAHWSASTSPT